MYKALFLNGALSCYGWLLKKVLNFVNGFNPFLWLKKGGERAKIFV